MINLNPATSRWIFWSLLALTVALGAALRVPNLTIRPMHTDEAVHAYKFGILLDSGVYEYDPHEYHGPTIYYFTLPLVWLTGARSYADIPSETPLRLTIVLFGLGLILLLPLVGDGIGRRGALIAAVFTAVSPAFVFYSRYYIQEMLLVFFTFGAIGFGWRYTRSRKLPWALASGACLGLMHASKETSVIAYFAMAGGIVLMLAWTRLVDRRTIRVTEYFHHWHLVGAVKMAIVVAILFLTAMLSNLGATIDSVMTYVIYLRRGAVGEGSTVTEAIHNWPWHFYLQRLLYYKHPGVVWSEAVILALALVGMAKALWKRTESDSNQRLLRFLTFYTLLMLAVYSLIPYKTPWCLLGFWHGMILMAGVGVMGLYRMLPHWTLRVVWLVMVAWSAHHLGAQAWKGNHTHFHSDPRNPYVYAQTSTDFLNLVKRMEDIAAVSPQGNGMLIKAFALGGDIWPLPWYARNFNVAYFNGLDDPRHAALSQESPLFETFDAHMIIIKPEPDPEDLDEPDEGAEPDPDREPRTFEERLKANLILPYQTEFFGLRPGETPLIACIYMPLWDAFIESMSAGEPNQ